MPTTINGTPAGETLTGTSADEQINGLGGNDSLIGNGGNDTLDGGAGNDTLDGGPETGSATTGDFATYASAPAGATVSLLAGTASDDGTAGVDTLIGIEHVIGSNFPDKLTGVMTGRPIDFWTTPGYRPELAGSASAAPI